MKVAIPSQPVSIGADCSRTAAISHASKSPPVHIEEPGKRTPFGAPPMSELGAPQQHQASDYQRPLFNVIPPRGRHSTERGASASAEEPSLDLFRHRRPQQALPISLYHAAPSRVPPPPPTRLEAGAGLQESFQQPSVSDIQVDGLEQTPWHEYEIPGEPEILPPNVPDGIRAIIQATLDEQRAIRLSRMQAPAIVVGRTNDSEHETQPMDAQRVVTKSSAMASNRHAASTSSSIRTQSFDLSLDSTTSLGSSTVGKDPVNLPDARASELEPKATSRQLQKSREKLSRAHGLFKMLRRPRNALVAAGIEQESETHECTSCFDGIPNKEAIGLPCRHRYCAPCFSQLIATALQNEEHFPPKCCLQEIPRRVLRKHLKAKELASFDDKALEYAVAVGSRYYCARPKCAKWIDPKKARARNGALECPHCSYSMCTECRGPVHPADQDCPQDFGVNLILEQAERSGWRRCYKCRALVELNTGCRHITCKCRAQFCYTCGARWRTCSCTEEDQARRAAQIRENLERLDAEVRAEEEEIRAAIAAVEAVEHQAAEAQRQEEQRQEEEHAEEARRATMREYQRVEKIVQIYNRLRDIMAKIHLAQTAAVTQRHDREMHDLENKETTLLLLVVDKENPKNNSHHDDDDDDDDTKRAEEISIATASQITRFRQTHASILIQTRARHRQDEDAFLLTLLAEPPSSSPHSNNSNYTDETDPATKLETLLAAQALERTTLRALQAREITKCKTRGADALRTLTQEREIRDRERERKREALREEARRVKRAQWAEWQWVAVLQGERDRLLGEDERAMVLSGRAVRGGLGWDRGYLGED